MSRTVDRIKLGLIAALVVIAVVVTVQNSGQIEVSFLFWDIEVSLSVLVILVSFAGLLVGWLLRSLRGASGFDLFGGRAAPSKG